MTKQKIAVHVWLDGKEGWNWVYLGKDGKLYIRLYDSCDSWDRLDNHVIDKASCELNGKDLYAYRKECTT